MPAPATLTVDLNALAANFRTLQAVGGVPVHPVVKADSYGLGSAACAGRLMLEGARTFFVARTGEGERLRAALGAEPSIYVLDGCLPGRAARLRAASLRPVLNADAQLAEWRTAGGGALRGPDRHGHEPSRLPDGGCARAVRRARTGAQPPRLRRRPGRADERPPAGRLRRSLGPLSRRPAVVRKLGRRLPRCRICLRRDPTRHLPLRRRARRSAGRPHPARRDPGGRGAAVARGARRRDGRLFARLHGDHARPGSPPAPPDTPTASCAATARGGRSSWPANCARSSDAYRWTPARST
jgi:hypothetical protein